jgi:hypothetical protein
LKLSSKTTRTSFRAIILMATNFGWLGEHTAPYNIIFYILRF